MAAQRYDRSVLEAHPACEPPEVPAALMAKIADANWPDGLLERVLRLRRNMGEIEAWLDSGFPTTEMIEAWVPNEEARLDSTLNVRQAGWDDNDLVTDLCANSPETVGNFEVVVERGPNAFAQFRLQENAYTVLVEDLRVGLGMVSRSTRNTMIDGERTSTHHISGWRVREGFRGMGLSNMLLEGPGPATSPVGVTFYWYVRRDNSDGGWVAKVSNDMADRPEGWQVMTDKLTAAVHSYHMAAEAKPSTRVRPVTEADLETCCRLINRTHEGLDLFRPYTLDFLTRRLDDQSWGPRPTFYPAVYGWDDYLVLEADGEIVACGGLWDRGRDVREVWTHKEDGHQNTIDTTALMDFGFAEGHDEAMAEMISHFVLRSADLGRMYLLAPLEFLPEVAAHCASLSDSALPEVRELHVMPMTMPGLDISVNITRPYTDLAYW